MHPADVQFTPLHGLALTLPSHVSAGHSGQRHGLRATTCMARWNFYRRPACARSRPRPPPLAGRFPWAATTSRTCFAPQASHLFRDRAPPRPDWDRDTWGSPPPCRACAL